MLTIKFLIYNEQVKLLQLNTTVNSGSTGRIAEDIGQIMMANGHQSYIAYGRGDRPSQSELIRIGSQLDVIAHGLKTALLDRHGFGSRRATEALVRQIRALQPDVIGMHNIHGYYLNVDVLFDFFAEAEIPVVWTLHDCWPFTGHCTFYDSIGCERWKTQCYACPKKDKYPRSYLFDNSRTNYLDKQRIFNSARNLQLVTPSQWLADQLAQSYLKDVPVVVIHNGVDTTAFKPDYTTSLLDKYHFGDTKIVLGVASTWDERKGLSEFLKLQKQLPAHYKIVLVGLSPEQIKSLPPAILGIPRTESLAELNALYARADVYANPTFQDNFPNTNIEALASGSPVVAYRTGGCPEAVDEQTGRIVAVGDVNALTEAILDITKRNRNTLRQACRKRALSHFDKKDRYLDYLALYEKKLATRV
jgi:glycosyltransferase involved in cell wall biosynthesis